MTSCKDTDSGSEIDAYYIHVESCLNIMEDNPSNYVRLMIDCMVGSEIPPFQTKSIEGEVINKDMLKGKVTLINFWFSACPPCVAEIPGFATIIDKYGKDKINYIAFGDNSKEEIEKFLKAHPWDFKHISNENDIIENIFKVELFGYPTTYLLNEDAQIVKSFSGGKSGDQAITDMLNKLLPAIEKELE